MPRQGEAYCDSLKKHRFDCKYMGFIDGDEFVLPLSDKRIPEIMDEIFEKDPSAASVGVNWRHFGSSGHIKKPKDVLTSFTRCSKIIPKAIFNPNITIKRKKIE